MKRLIPFLAVSFIITGCGASEPPKKVEKEKPLTNAEKLKNKARVVKAGNLLGYDGNKIQRNLNKIIDSGEKQKHDLDNALKNTR